MGQTMRDTSTGTPQQNLPAKSGGQLKAAHEPEVAGSSFREVAAEALKRTTSQKGAALTIKISEGRLSSKLKDGTLTVKQLEALGPTYLARFGDVCHEQSREDPQARIRRAIREARQKIDELAEAL